MAEEERTRDSHLGFSLTPKTPVTSTHIPVTGMNCKGGWGMWGKSRIIQRASDTSTACPQNTKRVYKYVLTVQRTQSI